MERPPISQAPTGWLEHVVEDLVNEPDDREVGFTIISAEDEERYEFTFPLGEIRAELRKRMTN